MIENQEQVLSQETNHKTDDKTKDNNKPKDNLLITRPREKHYKKKK